MASYHEVQDINSKSGHNQKSKKVLHSIELERSANGGVIAKHRFKNDGPGYHEPEVHTFGAKEGAKVLAHLKEHMSLKGDSDSAAGAAS